MNWMKSLILLLLLIISTLILLIITEYVLQKKIGLGQPIVYDAHPLWGYTPKPNNTYSRIQGSIVSINNKGLRSKIDWIDGSKKILFLGDSVTYGGSFIGDDQTFVSIACDQLTDWECFNGGVNAYGILNMVARSRYDERLQDDLVRVFTFISADFERGLQNESTAHFILRDPPSNFPALWEVGNFIAAMIRPKFWFGKAYKKNLSEDAIKDQQLVNQKFSLDVLMLEIDRLKSNGKDFLLVHSPTIEELNNPNLLDNNEIVNTLIEKYPGNFVKLSKALKKPFLKKTDNLFKDCCHYESVGHFVVGRYLGKLLFDRLK